MNFGAVNYLAVLAAAVASFIFGGLWYSAFSRRPSAESADEETEHRQRLHVNAVPFIVAFIALLIMSYVLAGAIGNLGVDRVTVRNGIVLALFAWVGFVMTTLVINHTVQRVSRIATLDDGGHWLGVLMIQGAIIGWIGL